jgi:hypothetical protein
LRILDEQTKGNVIKEADCIGILFISKRYALKHRNILSQPAWTKILSAQKAVF